MNPQLTPNKDHRPFDWTPGRLGRKAVVTIDQLAEEAYVRDWGPRNVKVHLIKRALDSQPGRFVLQERFLPFVKAYPDNVSVFYEVDLVGRKANTVGWLRHSEIQKQMLEEDHWVVYASLPLNPMSSYSKEKP